MIMNKNIFVLVQGKSLVNWVFVKIKIKKKTNKLNYIKYDVVGIFVKFVVRVDSEMIQVGIKSFASLN